MLGVVLRNHFSEGYGDFNRAIDSAFCANVISFENVIVVIVLSGQVTLRVLLAGGEFPRNESSDHLSWAACRALACRNLARAQSTATKLQD
jgi:hypothetical protein